MRVETRCTHAYWGKKQCKNCKMGYFKSIIGEDTRGSKHTHMGTSFGATHCCFQINTHTHTKE